MKSGLKIAAIVIAVAYASLVIAFNPRFKAFVWHLEHGNSVKAGELQIPVPSEWMVNRFDTGQAEHTDLINTKGGRASWGVITITEWRPWARLRPLQERASQERQLMENTGVRINDARELLVGGSAAICIDGEGLVVSIPVRHISCQVEPNISLEYVGSSVKAPAFYTIVAAISKTRKG